MKQQEKDGELNERASQTPSDWSGPRSGRSTERPGFVSVAHGQSVTYSKDCLKNIWEFLVHFSTAHNITA